MCALVCACVCICACAEQVFTHFTCDYWMTFLWTHKEGAAKVRTSKLTSVNWFTHIKKCLPIAVEGELFYFVWLQIKCWNELLHLTRGYLFEFWPRFNLQHSSHLKSTRGMRLWHPWIYIDVKFNCRSDNLYFCSSFDLVLFVIMLAVCVLMCTVYYSVQLIVICICGFFCFLLKAMYLV